jgi:hypothetical protein
MFLILKTTDWKEEDYINGNIIPFGWCEDNNRAILNLYGWKFLYKCFWKEL